MTKLNKEDIQAIAQELHKLQAESGQDQAQHASAPAQCGATVENPKPTKKTKSGAGEESHQPTKNIASIVLFAFWAVVFVILLVKVWAYI